MKWINALFPIVKLTKALNQANNLILAQSELIGSQARYMTYRDENSRKAIIDAADKVKIEATKFEEIASE